MDKKTLGEWLPEIPDDYQNINSKIMNTNLSF